jgi:hypothetical protein
LSDSLFGTASVLSFSMHNARKPTLFRALYLFAGCAGGKNAFRPYFIGVKRTYRLVLGGLWVALCG